MRSTWLDASRGIGITLVVLGHALHGLIEGGQIEPGSPLQMTQVYLSTFRMPLFWTLAGLFVASSLRHDPKRYVATALQRIMYPYVLWNTITLILLAMAGNLANNPLHLEPSSFIELLWRPSAQYWFLYTLFLYRMLALVFDKVSNV